MDEDRLAVGALAGNALVARNRGLFVGGMPSAEEHGHEQVYKGFSGSVADLIVDSK